MKTRLFFLIFAALLGAAVAGGAEPPSGLRTDLLEPTETLWRGGFAVDSPLEDADASTQFAAIRSSKPSFSWVVNDWRGDVTQTAYQLELYADGDAPIYSSGAVESSDSTAVPYGGEPLAPSTVYRWRVKTANNGDWSDWSLMKKFRTAETLDDGRVSQPPSIFERQAPVSSAELDEKTLFYDFGRAAFARVVLTAESAEAGSVTVRLGERVKDGRVDRAPAGSTRYAEYTVEIKPGRHVYEIATRRDKRNSSGAAVLVPPYLGEVMPLRYAEIERSDGVRIVDFVRFAAFYPFDSGASAFECDDERLNAVWDFCKYSIQATSFLGLYIDGDRERIPYEGDALLNQLSHYATDSDYSLARATWEYLIFHPTWPTEWILQTVQIAWYDYLYTGDLRGVARYYDELKAKSLTALAEPNGLISTRLGKMTRGVLDSIHFSGKEIRDIVDWPHKGLAGNDNADSGETDGFVFCDFNAVVNAYYYFSLRSMEKFASLLGKTDDAAFYRAQRDKVAESYQSVFFDSARGIYRDGDATDHASLHANVFALCFGLVPEEHRASVAAFIRSRGMKCSVYGAQFLLDAAYEGGDGDYGFERMTDDSLRGWLNMMKAGSTISMEAWDDAYKPNQDWNHAWGAAPANIIPRRLVGVEPLTPGCGRIRIKPQIAELKRVSAKVPTIRGPVGVEIRREDARTVTTLAIPANVTAEVWILADAGEKRLALDGRPVTEIVPDTERVGAYWKIPALGSGVRTLVVE